MGRPAHTRCIDTQSYTYGYTQVHTLYAYIYTTYKCTNTVQILHTKLEVQTDTDSMSSPTPFNLLLVLAMYPLSLKAHSSRINKRKCWCTRREKGCAFVHQKSKKLLIPGRSSLPVHLSIRSELTSSIQMSSQPISGQERGRLLD